MCVEGVSLGLACLLQAKRQLCPASCPLPCCAISGHCFTSPHSGPGTARLQIALSCCIPGVWDSPQPGYQCSEGDVPPQPLLVPTGLALLSFSPSTQHLSFIHCNTALPQHSWPSPLRTLPCSLPGTVAHECAWGDRILFQLGRTAVCCCSA